MSPRQRRGGKRRSCHYLVVLHSGDTMLRLAKQCLKAPRCLPTRPAWACPAVGAPSSHRYNSTLPPSNSQITEVQNEAESALEEYEDENPLSFPDLMQRDALLDDFQTEVFPPGPRTPHETRVTFRNETSLSKDTSEGEPIDDGEGESPALELSALTARERGQLHQYPLIDRWITKQTGKGKVQRSAILLVVGNGDGLVGYGIGKDPEYSQAHRKALVQAIRNMDYVDRFENRTVWTEMETKLGTTKVIIRPRPVGFGLRCNPNVHQVLKAAGIKDASVKVWGSRNPMNVINAVFRMLHAGNAPLAMGNGIGGSGQKLSKGTGMRSAGDIERERGRRLVSLRTA